MATSARSAMKGLGRVRVTFNSPVVLGFVAICVAVQVASTLTNGAIVQAFFMTYRTSFLDPFMYVRFLTHVFGHSGWSHLVNNMSYILLLGPLLEEKYGSRTLVEVMVLTALGCGLVNALLFPGQALAGASGICFAFILLSSVTSLREGEIPLTFILVATLYLGQQVFDGLFVRDNISQLSHIIGGLLGGLSGFALSSETPRK